MLDYYDVLDMLGDEEKQVQRRRGRSWIRRRRRTSRDYWERGEFPRHLVPRLGEMGYFGANLPLSTARLESTMSHTA